jgi:DNA-binding CsgD family transcriptional regulator
MLCETCPKSPFCSTLCPEAELYANQDRTARREFFSFGEVKYSSKYSRETLTIERPPSLTRTEWKILTLLKKDCTRAEISEILDISRSNLRRFLLQLKRKTNALGPSSD